MTVPSTSTRAVGSSVYERMATAHAALLQAHEEVVEAARQWGIRPNHPEGRFVSGLLANQRAFSDTAMNLAIDLDSISQAWLDAAKVDLQRQESAAAQTKHLIKQMDWAIRDFDAEKSRMADAMLQRAIPQLVKGVREATAAREVRIAQRMKLTDWLSAAFIGAALVVGGYTIRSIQMWSISDHLHVMYETVENCEEESPWKDPEGNKLCPLAPFMTNRFLR